jgi:hypothetical protein
VSYTLCTLSISMIVATVLPPRDGRAAVRTV